MTINSSLCFLLSGRKGTPEELLEQMSSWLKHDTDYNYNNVGVRYYSLTGQFMSNFMGLQIFTKLLELLHDNPRLKDRYVTKEAEQKILYYHNIQYDSSKNSELLKEGTTVSGAQG